MRRHLLHIAWLLIVPLAGTVGCAGGSSGPPSGSDDDASGGQVDAGPPTTDGNKKELVATVEIRLKPARHVYSPGTKLEGTAVVYDADGNQLDDPDTRWSTTPSDGAEKRGGGKFELKQEGTLEVRACATLEGGRDVCGSKEIAVDAGRPEIQLDKPAAGALLGGNGDGPITVEGRVVDSHGKLTAFLNGERLELDDKGRFSTEYEPTFGVNTLHVVASDSLNRSDATTTRAFLWAPHYGGTTQKSSKVHFSFDDGVAIDLGQDFFDDGEPPMRKTKESKLITEDFADILTVLTSNLDLASQIPSPVVDSGDTKFDVKSVNLGTPDITVDVTDDGLDVYLHVDNLVLQTSGTVKLEGQKLDLTGTASGRISAFAAVSVKRKTTSSTFESNVEEVDISLDRLTSSFADKKANAIFELADGVLRTKLEKTLVDALRSEVVAVLPKMLNETLTSLEKSLSDQSFSFESDLTGKRTVDFQGEIRKFETAYRKSIFALLANDIETAGSDIHPNAPGIPMMVDGSSSVPLFDSGRIQIGLRLGLLNGMLTTLWKTSYLELDLSKSLPSNLSGVVEKADVSGKMPPVIRPARRTEPYDLVLEAGQIVLSAEALEQTDTYSLNLRVGVDVSLADNKLVLSVPDKPMLDSWLIQTTGDSPIIEPDDLNALILSKVWPTIQKSLKGGLQLNLPVPDISNLSQIAPTLNNLTLDFVLTHPVAVRRGFLMFDSTLQGTLPLGQ